MTGPPPLSLRLGSGARERAWCAAVWLLVGLAMGLWMQAHGWLDLHGLAPMLGALLGATAGAWLARPMQGQLLWDGQAWHLRSTRDAQGQAIDAVWLAIDLGAVIALRARPGRWALVTRRDAGAQWHGLQIALRLGRGSSGREVLP